MSLRSEKNQILYLVCIAIIAGLLAFTGCETTQQPSTSTGNTGGSTVNLSSPSTSPASLAEGQTSIIEIIATDGDGDPVKGIEIVFGISPSAGGTFTPPTATTDSLGIAASVFTASQSGSMQIYGSYGSKSSNYTQMIVAGAGQTNNGNLTMSLAPVLLIADGSSTATVIVHVTNNQANPAPDSTLVKLVSGEKFVDVDGNGYWSTGDTLQFDYNANDSWDPIGIIPSFAYTEGGSISVTFTAGVAATTTYIKATVNGTGIYDGSVEASLQLTPDATINSIELFSENPGIQVEGTGGVEVTNLNAICYDIYGNTVPEGLPIQFAILDHPNGGENINGESGVGVPVEVLTNSEGVATVQVWSGTNSGTIRIRASAGSVLSSYTTIAVYAGPPYYITVGSEQCNLAGWNTVNLTQVITASVSDFESNPVQDSVVVYFKVDEGIIGAYGLTDDDGIAHVVFRTGAIKSSDDGIVVVTAETSGGSLADTSYFINSYIPATLTLAISDPALEANSNAETWLVAEVLDLNGNYVIGGTTVKGRALYGSVNFEGTKDGCNASVAEGTYTSTTLDHDYSLTGANDDGIGAIDIITCRTNSMASGTIACTLKTGITYYKDSDVSLDEATVPFGAAGNIIRVVIKDRAGNPLGDHTITGVISNGTITLGTAETNTYGEAVLRFTAPADATNGTTAIITITDNDPRGGVSLSTSVTYE